MKRIDYVYKNTYLCQYQGEDPEKILQLEPVVYLDYYRTVFKFTLSLKELKKASPAQDHKIDVVFPETVGQIPQISKAI